MIRWRAALTITGAFLLAVGAAAPAARAEDQDGESTSLVTVSDLSGSTNQTQTLPEATTVVPSEGSKGSAEEKAAESQPEIFPPWEKPSPAGCRGSTAYPHKAHRGENMVSVHAVTECGQTVERVEVVTMVLRDRWWGLEYVMSGSSSHI